jgi:hypothetical protein
MMPEPYRPDGTANPWKRLARTVAYENPWIRVFHDEVLRPDGRPGIYGVVHYHNRAVAVVALDTADRVLLVGQYRYTLDLYSWEVPEGGAAEGEDVLAAARRELREETGYTADRWEEIARRGGGLLPRHRSATGGRRAGGDRATPNPLGPVRECPRDGR